ncbi:HAD family hydrolase [Desulfosarcina sp.]|uniref:HAD family hydrolase n=1 Tax=Desulfosarcina sp. TaxID=2027861 RepID=UPI003567D785
MKPTEFRKIKGIVFDLDDTLYPQVAYKRSGFQVVSTWVAEQFNMDASRVQTELEAILNHYGPSYPHMFDRLVERLGIGIGFVERLVRLFIDHDPRICCYDGVIPMLSRLREKYLLGILTDGRYAVQRKKIKALGLDTRVDHILCSDALGLEKPDSRLFDWFEKKFQLAGWNLMYVGDNIEKDFYGANIRGWTTVMVRTTQPMSSSISASYVPQVAIQAVLDLDSIFRYDWDDGDHSLVPKGKHGVYA